MQFVGDLLGLFAPRAVHLHAALPGERGGGAPTGRDAHAGAPMPAQPGELRRLDGQDQRAHEQHGPHGRPVDGHGARDLRDVRPPLVARRLVGLVAVER